MKALGRRMVVLTAALASVAAGCIGAGPGRDIDIEARLARGRAYAGALITRGTLPADSLDQEDVLALGYLERLRMGLGSPFRLIDYAVHDPRLDEADRRLLGWALLANTADGRSYRVDASVFGKAAAGRRHLELIVGVIRGATGPGAGELSVRLGYALARTRGLIDQATFRTGIRAAALLSDRSRSQAGAARLLEAAREEGRSPLRLLERWREERRFAVERPGLEPWTEAVQREAARRAPAIARALHEASGWPVVRTVGTARPRRSRPATFPGMALAGRWAEIAATGDMPPQTPVVVMVDLLRHELVAAGARAGKRAAARRFIRHADNEASFAAEYSLLIHQLGGSGPALARLALRTAVALRAYAQEQPWFPGFGGPSARELEARFGLAAVQFDPDVPEVWHPYYRRMLARSLEDLERVLPALDVEGLRVRFGESSRGNESLALHDPTERIMFLPPRTGAGTIAHEIAHDLDWQIALDRFRVQGDYGTDRATRRGYGLLAEQLDRMAQTPLLPPAPGSVRAAMHARRPAEVFARNLDWFVAAALAQQGRMNGYLSSVQDGLLTGYGTVRPPHASGAAAAGLVRILDEYLPVYPAVRAAFLERFGPDHEPTVQWLVRRIADGGFHADEAFASRVAALLQNLGARPFAVRDAPCDTSASGRFQLGAESRACGAGTLADD